MKSCWPTAPTTSGWPAAAPMRRLCFFGMRKRSNCPGDFRSPKASYGRPPSAPTAGCSRRAARIALCAYGTLHQEPARSCADIPMKSSPSPFTRMARGWPRRVSDRAVWLWDLATGEEVARLQGPTAYVWSLTFSPDGGDAGVRLRATARFASGARRRRFEGIAIHNLERNPLPISRSSQDASPGAPPAAPRVLAALLKGITL